MNNTQDMNGARNGEQTARRFVLPMMGFSLSYHKTTAPYSFSVQKCQMGEIKVYTHIYIYIYIDTEPIYIYT